MFNTLNITGLEMSAQYSPIQTHAQVITHKPNVEFVTVQYRGAGCFQYFVSGKNGRREISREFAHDVLTQETKAN